MNREKAFYWLDKIIGKNKWGWDDYGWRNCVAKNYIMSVTQVKNDYQNRCIWIVVKRSEIIQPGKPEGMKIGHGDAGSIKQAEERARLFLVNYILENDYDEWKEEDIVQEETQQPEGDPDRREDPGQDSP